MRSLKELYELNLDVRESEIPIEYRDSFNKFIIGSACIANYNEDGSFKELVYYSCDFKSWYYQNRVSINRDIIIDIILE